MDMFPKGWWIFPAVAITVLLVIAFGLGAWIF